MDAEMYENLRTVATNFIDSCRPKTAGSNEPNADAILANLDDDRFRMDWGHKTFVASNPPLQGAKSGHDFVTHLSGMAPGLETWSIEIQQVIVDTKQKTAMVRADFFMVPKGTVPAEERTILNDIILTFEMNESGEKLIAATEFVDPTASAEIGKLMAASKPDYV